jgi:osmotically inducible protein OsmC
MARHAEAEWKGDLKGGSGRVKFGSGTFDGAYSFSSRFEDGVGANPEEKLGGALSGCFSMALANSLAQAGFPALSVHTKAEVHLGKDEQGFKITRIDLTVTGDVPGVPQATFDELVEKTRTGCIIARALAATPIAAQATLRS